MLEADFIRGDAPGTAETEFRGDAPGVVAGEDIQGDPGVALLLLVVFRGEAPRACESRAGGGWCTLCELVRFPVEPGEYN